MRLSSFVVLFSLVILILSEYSAARYLQEDAHSEELIERNLDDSLESESDELIERSFQDDDDDEQEQEQEKRTHHHNIGQKIWPDQHKFPEAKPPPDVNKPLPQLPIRKPLPAPPAHSHHHHHHRSEEGK
jgi:hypothetical protein